MQDRIRFGALVPLVARPALTAGLLPLAGAGYEVDVLVPEFAPELGWDVRILLTASRSCFLCLPKNATEDQWTSFLARALPLSVESEGPAVPQSAN